VSGRVVVVEKPIVILPHVRRIAPNALHQPLQNLSVKLAIDGVRILYGQFLGCRKNINMDLTLLRN
jgi:hypothetical protein